MRQRSRSVLSLLAVPTLAVLAPGGAGPTAPLVAAVAVAAWLCTGWLLVVALLERCASLPVVGRLAAGAVRRIAPQSVRSVVRVALGVGVAASVLTGPAALAVERPPIVAGSSSDALDWPGVAPSTAWPLPQSTAATSSARPALSPATVAPPQAAPTASPRSVPVPPLTTVEVHRGDSLWSIARRALGPGASEAEVARAWPSWWSVNRSVVGDHPGLIHPGDRLSAP